MNDKTASIEPADDRRQMLLVEPLGERLRRELDERNLIRLGVGALHSDLR